LIQIRQNVQNPDVPNGIIVPWPVSIISKFGENPSIAECTKHRKMPYSIMLRKGDPGATSGIGSRSHPALANFGRHALSSFYPTERRTHTDNQTHVGALAHIEKLVLQFCFLDFSLGPFKKV